MNPHEDDALSAQLAALPSHDVAPETAQQIARVAHAALADSAHTPSWLNAVERFYTRVIEPPLVFGACAIYLVWAVQTLNATGFAAAERAMNATAQHAAEVRVARGLAYTANDTERTLAALGE